MIPQEPIEGLVPPNTAESLRAYIETGRPTGGFLKAVLSNDLFGAYARADVENVAALPALVRWVYNNAPRLCWGSEDRVEDWMKMKRENAALARLIEADPRWS